MVLGLLIPVYNERALLRESIERLLATPTPTAPGPEGVEAGLDRRVFLCDDGSSDGTTEVVRELGEMPEVTPLFHPVNQGKGAALRTALHAAVAASCDVLLVHDADLEYDPADHADVLRPILDGRADAVIGSRFLGHTHRVLYYWHYVANTMITRLSNMFSNLNLSDIECCSKAFTLDVARRLTIEENRFGVEPELVARLARMRLPGPEGRVRPPRIYEVPVSYAGRTYDEGKKIGWRDGVSALRCILKYGVLA
ncbi:MAG: glycosyltransferase family 2 protein [Phycisphaerae bacterium]|nr:glycosyltransferase family 2 protein [Phycisphaerae bacterium]